MSQKAFDELDHLQALIAQAGHRIEVDILLDVRYHNQVFPVHCITLGSKRVDAPVLAFFGGVHGLEKIGTEVILAYLTTLIESLDWDYELMTRLEQCRLVFVPIVNPVGVYRGTRSNANGVDLMRNAPVDGTGRFRLYSGHRLTRRLPWYRGDESQMEAEAEALCRVVRQHLFSAPVAMAIDLHSGFGIQDRLWFPYASKRAPFPHLAETFALKALFDRTYPQHVYRIEPTSNEYVIHGDLWDYLYDEFNLNRSDDQFFLPLTLEMGSWLWLRKSPLHLFYRHGWFHPLLPHRRQRILRRHLILFDFLIRALLNPAAWARSSASLRKTHHEQAMRLWYGHD